MVGCGGGDEGADTDLMFQFCSPHIGLFGIVHERQATRELAPLSVFAMRT